MTKYIKGFDGLRCYSILLVIITHLGISHYFEKSGYLRENVFYFFSGSAGVNVFFVISGFLITTLILNELKETGKFNIKFFFIRRFLRLLPPMIPFFVAILIFMKLGYIRQTLAGLFLSIFYLFNFVPKAKVFWSTELSHTWSLAVEEQFYIMWAFIFNFLNSNKIKITIFLLLILCVIASYLLPSVNLRIKGEKYLFDQVFFSAKWTIPAIGPILIGALFAFLNFSNWNNIQNKFSGVKPLILSIMIFLSPFYTPVILLPLINLFHGFGVALVLLWITNNQSSTLVKLLEWKPIKYIGTISYGIYIWQGFFVRTGPNITPKIWVHDFPQNVALTLFIAIISYELLEKRILNLKKKFKLTSKEVV
jgi:peptidoglycan/LPS O-acetylase OafA/YrhL